MFIFSVSTEDSTSGEWNDNLDEPELEFDETALELAAQDGKLKINNLDKKFCVVESKIS